MVIKYRHCSEPEREKMYDTKLAFKQMFHLLEDSRRDYETFKNDELQHFADDKARGTVLDYEVVEED